MPAGISGRFDVDFNSS